MKPEAILVNTARGPIVDEAALARALREKWITAAGIDVFEREPEVHPDLLACENAVLAPHVGSASVATRTKMTMMASENALAALGRSAPAESRSTRELGDELLPASSRRMSRSEGWNVVTGTLFKSSSRSTTWLRIRVRNWSTDTPNSSAASTSEY